MHVCLNSVARGAVKKVSASRAYYSKKSVTRTCAKNTPHARTSLESPAKTVAVSLSKWRYVTWPKLLVLLAKKPLC